MAAQSELYVGSLAKTAPQSRWKHVMHGLRRDKFLYLLIAPGVLFFLIFKYVPMWGVVIAFQDYSPYLGVTGSQWVGFEHFIRFFKPRLLSSISKYDGYQLAEPGVLFPAADLTFPFIERTAQCHLQKMIQSIVYMPHFLSWVIIAGITFLLLSQSSGIVNKMLVSLGVAKYDFLTNENNFWVLLTVQNVWKEAGWGTIIFLAAIAGVDPQQYEAAKMDGANRIRQAWHVTLPAIRSVIVVLFILKLGHIMDVGFEQVFLMMNGAVSNVADVFETYVFRLGIQQGQFSFSTAVGLFKSVVGLILVIAANKLAKRFGEEGVY